MGSAHGSADDTLDPAFLPNAFITAVSAATHNTLTAVGTDGAIEADLAEHHESTPDARRWIFDLRTGLEFHNGKRLTTTDVIESINYHRKADSKSAVKSLLAGIEDIRSDGPSRVVVTLKDGTADLPFYLADKNLPIYPSKDGGGIEWAAGVGTGPMMLDNLEPGVKAILRKNPSYYKPGRPYFDGAEIYSIPDVAARASALMSGRVDYIDRAEAKTLDRLSRVPSVETLVVKGTSHYTAPMNATSAPFNDRNVRLAVKYAIDREEIVRKILAGYGVAGNDDPVADGQQYRIDPQPRHVYDVDKAKFYLKQAGLDHLDLTLTASDAAFAGAVDTAVLIQDSAAKAGIGVNVERVPSDGYWSSVWMKRPWCLSYWNGRPTCDMLLSALYTSDAPWNESFFKNERFDALSRQARPELDPSKRAEIFAEMQDLIHEDSGQIVLMFNYFLSAHSKRLRHPDGIARHLDQDGFRLYERWWFA